MGRTPILPDSCAVIIDEAHKLPEAARQMFGNTLEARDIEALIRSLRREKFILAAENLAELSTPLLQAMAEPFGADRPFADFARLLIAPLRGLSVINTQLHDELAPSTYRQLKKLTASMELFNSESHDAVFYTMEDKRGSVLLATGAAWEGFDFPGDCVSLLIIPRLPFSQPDALKKKERTEYPSLRAFIQAVVVPEMQIKLRQGFGRAIRTETDTCVVAILDERAVPGARYFQDMIDALPEMPVTDSLEKVVEFVYQVKRPDYFQEAGA